MSFLKRLVPLKADMRVTLQSPTVEQGRPFNGSVELQSRGSFRVEEVRLEIRAKESYWTSSLVVDRGGSHPVSQRRSDTLFSQDVPVSLGFDMREGEKKEFPFEVTIPMYMPSHYGGSISYELKGVANVKGRPDITHSESPMVVPSAGTTKVIEREVIKVPCRYCGAFVELTAGINQCPSCGAPIKLG